MSPPSPVDAWPVAIFAHNEADHIAACLDSITAAADDHAVICYVLANACTDATESAVRRYAEKHPGVQLVSIALGDKANAWNVYVHEVAPESDVHFFIDGDVSACPSALTELNSVLVRHPQANAASALPETGRSVVRTRQVMLEGKEIAGNLYALSGRFVNRIREAKLRMPIGFIGEDSLIGALAKWDLDPNGAWKDDRIVPCAQAGFAFESVSPFSPADWKLYWHRRIRYSIRSYQIKMLRTALKQAGLVGMPQHIKELYPGMVDSFRVGWNGVNTLFDWLALQRIRRDARPH